MIFKKTSLEGSYIIEPELIEDERGFFARTCCQREFKEQGLHSTWSQCSISFNRIKGTLRGMHYQIAPFEETKLVRCTSGALYDVIIDLRPYSRTYKQWISVELSASNRNMLYVPQGFAHGFLTRDDNTEVSYQISEFFKPEYAKGVRWNDPAFNITWPAKVAIISDKDRLYPDFIS
jgi:dTDP-4-dehydrorhamnose 3,5-epimerase